MNAPCPWCGCKAVDITTNDDMGHDRRRKYLCIGAESHEWRDGDGPVPEEPEPVGIIGRLSGWLKSL